mmetsp:Transcript_23149/g.68903  ORF Transcript_23149/g.68903 Transcript_23149/m.68903 type:complete len:203 (+) Transcript_23149:1733-2341(+)
MEEGGEEMLKVVPEEARERVVPLLCVRALIPAEEVEIPRPRPRLCDRKETVALHDRARLHEEEDRVGRDRLDPEESLLLERAHRGRRTLRLRPYSAGGQRRQRLVLAPPHPPHEKLEQRAALHDGPRVLKRCGHHQWSKPALGIVPDVASRGRREARDELHNLEAQRVVAYAGRVLEHALGLTHKAQAQLEKALVLGPRRVG